MEPTSNVAHNNGLT